MTENNTTMQEDLNAAKHLLRTHGFAFKIYGPEEVRGVLHGTTYTDLPKATEDKIIEHVMNGDDWDTISSDTERDEMNIFDIIQGTLHDHPEWTQTRQEWLEGIARDWMYRHGQAIYEGMAADIEEEAEVALSEEETDQIITLIENAEISIKF